MRKPSRSSTNAGQMATPGKTGMPCTVSMLPTNYPGEPITRRPRAGARRRLRRGLPFEESGAHQPGQGGERRLGVGPARLEDEERAGAGGQRQQVHRCLAVNVLVPKVYEDVAFKR